jgi:ABC-type nitrate/sulfonate/bicarbonate transport system substrate-binding protein
MKKGTLFKILTLFLTFVIFSCCSGCLFALGLQLKENEERHQRLIEKQKERKARADEIKAARQAIIDAQKRYNTLLDSFIKDYDSYHETYTSNDVDSHLDHILSRMFGI